jgi:hypothetical protein
MATSNDIGWGTYREYEGPFYRGRSPYVLPSNPTESDRILAVITATEGGRWDAYNGYDRCICTSGLIQWCEAGQYSVSDMLGAVAEKNRALIASVDAYAASKDVDFKKNARGRYRFFFRDERGEVSDTTEQRQLFLLRSNGKRGTWDAESKEHAKGWAAAISTVWEHPEAQRIQGAYTAARLSGFALPFARNVLAAAPNNDLGAAFKAGYLSFAANNPTWANQHLEIAMKASDDPAYSRDWLIGVLKQLTFGPNVAIYPHRYSAIRPVIERLYGVDLPDLAEDLKRWVTVNGEPLEAKAAQQILIQLGFDLGPWGADGIIGKATRQALITFQQQRGLEPSGEVDAPTRRALLAAREQLA